MVIREATKKDIEGIAVVHVDSWRITYKDIVPQEFLNNMSYENSRRIFQNIFNKKTEEEVIYAAELDGKIIGFAYAGPERSEDSSQKRELYCIYILKDYQNMKVGRKLLSSIANRFLRKGINAMRVEVLDQNTSKAFYEHMGAKKIGEKYMDRIPGVRLKELIYEWKDILCLL